MHKNAGSNTLSNYVSKYDTRSNSMLIHDTQSNYVSECDTRSNYICNVKPNLIICYNMMPDLIMCWNVTSNPIITITIITTINALHTSTISNKFIVYNLIVGSHFTRFIPSLPIHIHSGYTNREVNGHWTQVKFIWSPTLK